MITQNYIGNLLGKMYETSGTLKPVKKIDGSTFRSSSYWMYISLYYCRSYYSLLNDNIGSEAFAFGFGTGLKEPTVDDYCLESAINDDVFVTVQGTTAYNPSIYGSDITILQAYKYTGVKPITISEVGLFRAVQHENTRKFSPILLMRDVLSNPITVSNGDVFTVTMVLS